MQIGIETTDTVNCYGTQTYIPDGEETGRVNVMDWQNDDDDVDDDDTPTDATE